MAAEAENAMTSYERLQYYRDSLRTEGLNNAIETNPSPEWPQYGSIQFEKVVASYRPGLPPVLSNISFKILPNEKIGIVGRTGAGKSTITLVLLRLMEIDEGVIFIDNVDISTLDLHILRSRIAIIPQDPIIFKGSLRFNLDPFNRHTADQLWHVLEQVSLKRFARLLPDGLDSIVNGSLSMGQRQLLCVARALLKHAKILLLDEATASIDIETDNLIQKTIRENFHDCTILTIAHRLHTIIDSDRIMVLDQGKLVEFDTPQSLIQHENGFFTKLIANTDHNTAKFLKEAIVSGKKLF